MRPLAPPRRRPVAAAAVVVACLAGACSSGSGDGDAAPAPISASPTPSQSTVTAPPAPVVPSTAPPGPPVVDRRPTGQPVTLAFGGDTHFEARIAKRLSDDPSSTIGPISTVLSAADLAMVNLETAITSGGTPEKKTYVFRAPASAFEALRSAGVDVVSMANNHGFDYGPTGLRDTLAAAAASRFPVVGIGADATQAFRPYIVTVKGQRIAFLAATQVIDSSLRESWSAGTGKPGIASAFDEKRLRDSIAAAQKVADTVVVYVHWGEERNRCPIDRQQRLVRVLVDSGADVVVGTHAHVLQGAGYLNGAYVAFGLGNFVWYSVNSEEAITTGVLRVTVRGRNVSAQTWTPARIEQGSPIALTGSAATAATAKWASLRSCTGLAAR